MRASEKYAELEAGGLERPRCNCHDEPMVWGGKKTGGCWLCRIKRREYCRRWHETNRERALEYGRHYRMAHKDQKQDYNRLYYERNSERFRERSRKFREDNPEYSSLSSRRWREETNPDRYYEYQRARLWVMIGGHRFYVPDKKFKEFAIALRDERRRHQTEGATRG